VVYYDGENILLFGEKLFAVPISLLAPSATELANGIKSDRRSKKQSKGSGAFNSL